MTRTTEGLLDEFDGLGDYPAADRGQAIEAFTSKHGALGVCRHGVSPQHDPCCQPLGSEPLEIWRRWISRVRAFRRASACLRRGQHPDVEDARELLLLAMTRPPTLADLKAGRFGFECDEHPPSVSVQRICLASALEAWTVMAGVHGGVRWKVDQPAPERTAARGGVLGAVLTSLASEFCDTRRIQNRDASKKLREAKHESRALDEAGVPVEDIARRNGRPVARIERWLREPRRPNPRERALSRSTGPRTAHDARTREVMG